MRVGSNAVVPPSGEIEGMDRHGKYVMCRVGRAPDLVVLLLGMLIEGYLEGFYCGRR